MIFGILHNTKLDRYHPIAFRPAPMPSGADAAMNAQRTRSYGHHTEGFTTLDDAKAHVVKACEGGEHSDAAVMWEWDGDGVPAMTEWFSRPSIAA